MGHQSLDVMVVDANQQFVEYVSSALARRLIKRKLAQVLQQSPFAIMLPSGMNRVPPWNAESDVMNTDTPSTPLSSSQLTPASQQAAAAARLSGVRRVGYSWNDYFMNKQDGEVWVQNLTDMQVSLDIETGHGQSEGKLVPPSPDPYNLTETYSFEILKKSARFRQQVAKRRNGRPILILLDSEQVESYYAAKARQMHAFNEDGSPNIDAALESAAQTRRMLTTREVDAENVQPGNAYNFAPPKSAQELIAMDLASRGLEVGPDGMRSVRAQAGNNQPGIQMHEIVKPRVLHLCQQVNPQIPEAQRMPTETLLASLKTMQHDLTMDDYAHIEAHGTYRSVKKWARERIAEMAQSDEGLPDTGHVAPSPSLAGQAQIARAQQGLSMVQPPQGFGPQGPASLGAQGFAYQGPQGFANAPFREAQAVIASPILGPDGNPLD